MQPPFDPPASSNPIHYPPVTVTLCLGSQSFQRKLAATMWRRGMLRRVLAFGLEVEVFDPDARGELKLVHRYRHYRLAVRLLWAAWRRLPGSRRSRNLPVAISTRIADWLASHWVPASDVFHGWTSVCLASMRTAKRQGAATLIENATMHPRAWQQAVIGECRAFGVDPRDCRAMLPEILIRRMEREFAACDKIIVPSELAQRSFEEAGYAGKAIVVHAGVDHEFFCPPSQPRERRVFRVCYVGRVELAKGVPYLLQAWQKLALPNAELVLVGEVAPEIGAVVRQFAQPNVRFRGMLGADEVAACYRDSHLFAFPSVNEGLARVLFEAMASGLPVVATGRSGAEDCVTPGVDGTIVPARDAPALADAWLGHDQNPEGSAAMGRAGRLTVEKRFTQAHYEERMIAVYRSVAAHGQATQTGR